MLITRRLTACLSLFAVLALMSVSWWASSSMAATQPLTPTPVPTPRPTTPPAGPNGQIVFARFIEGKQFEIFIVNADGDYPATRITYNTEGSTDPIPPKSDFPVWSPDNKKIAFRVASTNAANNGIYLINPDGTNQTRLTTGFAIYPTWSPDGSKIAFVGDHNDIFIVNADGTNLTQITSSPRLQKMQTVWSPDGSKIAFTYFDLDTGTISKSTPSAPMAVL